MNDRAEQWFGPYQAIDVVERDDTALVYRGMQPSLGRTVAIKVLLNSRNPQFAARFRREARAVAQLEHHNILPVYDYGEQNGMLYVVTQHVEHGLTLRDILGDPMEPLAALQLISGVLQGLDYAHHRGVIHRNIKPASILLPLPEWPVLADFGIARFGDADQTVTMPGISLESAQYMAPELVESQPTDVRTDIYSLGAVLYHMVIGRPPFAAATPLATLQEHVITPLDDPRTHNPSLPDQVANIITQALAKAPADRFSSTHAMLEATQQAIAHMELSSGDQYVEQMYESGVQAFAEGDWNRALDQLHQVQELSPQHTSTTQLIRFAQQAQRRARQQAQTELARLHKQPLSPAERTTISLWSQAAPSIHRLPEVASSGKAANHNAGMFEHAMPPVANPARLRPFFYVAVILVALVLVAAMVMVANNGFIR